MDGCVGTSVVKIYQQIVGDEWQFLALFELQFDCCDAKGQVQLIACSFAEFVHRTFGAVVTNGEQNHMAGLILIG